MAELCPLGHPSETTDYCDQCGTPMDAAGSAVVSVEMSSATQMRVVPPPAGELCPRCQTPRFAGDRYCEVDGYDFEDLSSGSRPWIAVVAADRAFFDRVHADGIEFPARAPTLTHDLDGDVVTVGRRSVARDIHPDIDLSGPPEDPGVSREHLRLERTPDARYAVIDCGSANGTTLNDDVTPISPGTPVLLDSGDRIHLGAWTTITVHEVSAPDSA